ncbi:MAG: hypothetical protein NT086_08905 [Proteobacteria bacterium]|nr:hypothetical protein [Pseudomonadota bacterium]
MTIRCFRWDDAGAPQLGAASSLSVVLEKCLVDGYGTQAGLGWGKIKSPSGKVIAFQPQARAASRPWLAFDDRCLASMYGGDLRGSAPMALFDVLTGLNDDGTAQSGSVNGVPFSKDFLLCYRRNDGVVVPWLLLADSEKDYFYFLVPYFSNNSTWNGGTEGVVKNMTNMTDRKGVLFGCAVFGSVDSSMISGDSVFIWPAQKNTSDAAGGVFSSPNFFLPLLRDGPGMYKSYKDVAGDISSGVLRLFNSPLFVSNNSNSFFPLIKSPNPYSNKLLLAAADIRLYCESSKIFRGRLGGVVCSFNDKDAWVYGVDNCFSRVTQQINGSSRELLPILSKLTNTGSPTPAENGYLFFDLTGPW